MITLRPGSHMSNVLQLLSVSCEFPTRSLHILGDTRTIRTMIHKHKTPEQFKLLTADKILTTKLFQVSGSGRLKTLRLYRGALPLLGELHPAAPDYYLDASGGHRFSGGEARIERQHRVSEALAMCMMAGAEIRPYVLPKLQREEIRTVRLSGAGFYVARYIKTLFAPDKSDKTENKEQEKKKKTHSRIVGMLAYPGGAYAVYNTRTAVMKWRGKGELGTKQDLKDIARFNFGLSEMDTAILFGNNAQTALGTIMAASKVGSAKERFDGIYSYIHFVPLNDDGLKLIKILTLPDWKETMLDSLFDPVNRITGHTSVECDARFGDTLVYSHMDGDIARLTRLRAAVKAGARFTVVCFPWQQEYLAEYFADVSDSIDYKAYDMDDVMRLMGIMNDDSTTGGDTEEM